MKISFTLPSGFLFLIILCLGSASCRENNLPDPELRRWEEMASRVEIFRDSFGLPHIYGETDADAVFGLLYAQCEDDYPRVERNYLWAIGRLAEVEGEQALYSDLRARLFMTEEEARACYRKSPVWLKKLCDAFADGINYYLYTHPEEPRYLEHYENWMPFYFFEGSIGGNIESVRTDRIKEFYEQLEQAGLPGRYTEKETEVEAEPSLLTEPSGSNGIALAPKLTANGHAMLLINPHTSFYFRPEVHVVSKEGLNVYGAVTWGQFFVYQGFNEDTGWMHTSGYTDVIDEFTVDVGSDGGGLKYRVGTDWLDMEIHTTRLSYRDGDRLKSREFPIFRTRYGPVTASNGGSWTATSLMWDPVGALKQSYLRTTQSNFEEFNQVMDIRRNSSNNTVFADSEGNIAYYHGNFIPRRNPAFDYSRPVDGSNPATAWQGLHSLDESIILLNPGNGWIQNCNSTPYSAAGDYSPRREDYPSYFTRDREQPRSIHAISLLEKASEVDLNGLIDLAYDPFLPTFELILPRLVAAWDRRPDPELEEAIALLRDWDYRTSVDSEAMTLAHFYGRQILGMPRPAQVRGWWEVFRYWGESAPEEDCLQGLSRAIEQLEKDLGTWRLAWGEVNRFQRINGDLRQPFNDSLPSFPVPHASGIWGSLAAYGANYRSENARKIYGTRGNSFVAVVEFGERVKAKSLLAGGQSGRPDSPHFDDQIDLYIGGTFKDVLFYREEVVVGSAEPYRPGEKMKLYKEN